MKILIYGKGYLGEHFLKFLNEQGENAVFGNADIGKLEQVQADLAEHSPDVVLNCAGRTGRPNVDWCETHQAETIYGNVTGPLVLLQACVEAGMTHESGPRLVHLGSGCVYDGDNDGKGFTEDDEPNFDGSFYSRTKAWSERMLSEFPVLQLRLRMPIDANAGERNFISKILKYEKVINVPNSMTVIEDFLPASYELMKQNKTGIYNMTNPGQIDHKTILDLYKKIVDPNFTYELMSVEEMYKNYASAGRSNCLLNSDKLKNEGIHMRPVEEAIADCIEKGFK
jgi:dTDP-4-dehydrorhamnose reductase